MRTLGRLNSTAPRNTTRVDVREHGARLKRVHYGIDKHYSSSAAACNGASPTYGACQPRVIHRCKQHRLVARVRPFFDGKHRSILVVSLIQGYSVRLLGRFRTFSETRGKNEDSCRNRFARDARQRRVDVARRRRGWRSIAHTVSPCDYANPRCVLSTDAAHLASIVCRQPPKKSSQDRSKPLWTRRAV